MTDTERLLRIVERTERLVEEYRGLEQSIRNTVADMLDAGLPARLIDLVLASRPVRLDEQRRAVPLRLSDIFRSSFLMPAS